MVLNQIQVQKDTADSSSPGAEPDMESPVEETNPPETEHSSTMPRRYPTRARQPPNRYDPAGFGTNHVMVDLYHSLFIDLCTSHFFRIVQTQS